MGASEALFNKLPEIWGRITKRGPAKQFVRDLLGVAPFYPLSRGEVWPQELSLLKWVSLIIGKGRIRTYVDILYQQNEK